MSTWKALCIRALPMKMAVLNAAPGDPVVGGRRRRCPAGIDGIPGHEHHKLDVRGRRAERRIHGRELGEEFLVGRGQADRRHGRPTWS
jgi:hypothetical protein